MKISPSIKSQFAKNKLFAFIFICNQNSTKRKQANLVLFFINLIINFITFLTLQQVAILQNSTLFINFGTAIAFYCFLIVIVIQLLVCYFWTKQFYMCLQWKLFRNALFPPLTIYLFKQINSSDGSTMLLALLLQFLNISITLVMTATFTMQSYTYLKLLNNNLPINWFFLLSQILFYFILSCTKNQIITISIFIFLTSTLVIYNKLFITIKQPYLEYRLLSCWSLMHCFYGIILFLSECIETQYISTFSLMLIPIILLFIVTKLIAKSKPVDFKNFINVFQDPYSIQFEEFISSLQPIIQQIIEYKKQNMINNFVQTMISNYYYQHSHRCRNVQCPFKNQDYRYEFSNVEDRKVLKQIIFKICKKINFLFEGMYQAWPQNIQLKISMLQFYIFCYNNKLKALEIISQISSYPLSIFQKYQVFRASIYIQSMQGLEIAGDIKLDEQYFQFQNIIHSTLSNLIQFWNELDQDKVDFSKILTISQKIIVFRQKIYEIYMNRITNETFSTFKVLKLYSKYCYSIQKNRQSSLQINEYLQKLQSKLFLKKQIQYLSFDSETGLIALSLSQAHLGRIAMVNNQAKNIFGYQKQQFKLLKVNDIMPKVFADQHDNYLKRFLQNVNKKVNSDERMLYGKNKKGFIFPILLQLQRTVQTTGNQLMFIANINKIKTLSGPIVCIADEQGQIVDYSVSFKYLFYKDNLSKSKKNHQKWVSNTRNIQQIIFDFFQQPQTGIIKNYFVNTGQNQINFEVSQLSFPLKQKSCYIVRGQIVNKPLFMQFSSLSMTSSLEDLSNKQLLKGRKIFYNDANNRYQIDKIQSFINITSERLNFSLPFINFNQMTSFLKATKKEQNSQFGLNIRTIRLANKHFQPVGHQDSFQSEFYDQRQSSSNAIQLIDTQKEISSSKALTISHFIKIFLSVLIICVICLNIKTISSYSQYVQDGNNILKIGKNRLQVRAFVGQYIILYTAHKTGQFNSDYQLKMLQSRGQLIEILTLSDISQNSKEKIFKIAYLQQESDIKQLLNQQSINFDYNNFNGIESLIKIWQAIDVLICVVGLIVLLSYCSHFRQLQKIYQYFLFQDEKCIKKTLKDCRLFLLQIQKEKLSQTDQSLQLITQKINKELEHEKDQDEQQQNPLKKKKQQSKALISMTYFLFQSQFCLCLQYLCFVW